MTQTAVLLHNIPMIREGLERMLDSEFDIKASIETASEAVDEVREYKPNLAIVNLNHGFSGNVEVIKDIKKASKRTYVLVFSEFDVRLYIEQCLRAGAHGYISPSQEPDEILKAAKTVANGKTYLNNEAAQIILGALSPDNKLRQGNLRLKQFQVYSLLSQGKKTDEIASTLCIGKKTVDYHYKELRKTFQLNNNVQLREHAFAWLTQYH
ncbi:response regulator transcription factor [Candidatus Woesearchaeota archaeon]|nr:response regulator transcription factor [Candidatus Woesearchaeota archaeon]